MIGDILFGSCFGILVVIEKMFVYLYIIKRNYIFVVEYYLVVFLFGRYSESMVIRFYFVFFIRYKRGIFFKVEYFVIKFISFIYVDGCFVFLVFLVFWNVDICLVFGIE